jgi:hypothetical protein
MRAMYSGYSQCGRHSLPPAEEIQGSAAGCKLLSTYVLFDGCHRRFTRLGTFPTLMMLIMFSALFSAFLADSKAKG